MRECLAFLGVCAVLAACSTTPGIDSYEEAVAANAARRDAAAAQTWAESVIAPFWDKQFKVLLERCHGKASRSEVSRSRIVVRLDGARATVPFEQGSPAGFSQCLEAAVRDLDWPESPFAGLYFPIDIKMDASDAAAAAAEAKAREAAEKFMRDVTQADAPAEGKQ